MVRTAAEKKNAIISSGGFSDMTYATTKFSEVSRKSGCAKLGVKQFFYSQVTPRKNLEGEINFC